jgi:WD40 repeat protein
MMRTGMLGILAMCVFSVAGACQDAEKLVIDAHRGGVTCVSFSSDPSMLASGGVDGIVRLWDVRTGKELRALEEHRKEVLALAFSPDGEILASSGFDHAVKLWTVGDGTLVHMYGFSSYSTTLDISSRGLLAVGLQDATVHFFNAGTGKPGGKLEVQWPVYSLAFSSDGVLLATGGPVQIWNTETWERVAMPRAPGGVYDLDFAPDRPILVSAHLRGSAFVWSQGSFEKLHEFTSPRSFRGLGPKGTEVMQTAMPLAAAAFSADGTSVATGGADKIIRLWSLKSGEMIREFKDHTMSVVGLSFSPDGSSLASASLDGTVRVWAIR